MMAAFRGGRYQDQLDCMSAAEPGMQSSWGTPKPPRTCGTNSARGECHG